MYEIWSADLNSLYDDVPNPPVFVEDCATYEDAVKAKHEYQTYDVASWIQNKETGEIIS